MRIAVASVLVLMAGRAVVMAQESVSAEAQAAATAQRFCENIRDDALDARIVEQTRMLRDLEARIAEKVEQLEARSADYQAWVTRREAIIEQVNNRVSAIYSGMRPEAAALQLAELDADVAAAVLSSLVPRAASAILAEMKPKNAARLTAAIAVPSERVR